MLSIHNIKTAAQASHYFADDNYYTQGDDFEASYSGEIAKDLSLRKVSKERFAEFLQGKISKDSKSIQKKNHRAGLDCTFSASKSISIAAFALNDENIKHDMLQAHDMAVEKALKYLEKNCLQIRTTKNKMTTFEKADKMLAVKFKHDTSRELDAQLHTHCVIMNFTQNSKGEYKAISNENIYKNKMLLGLVYRAEIAKELRNKGYELEVKKDGMFELKGFSEKQIKEFSTRRNQINEYMKLKGYDTAEQAAIATLKTRRSKIEVDRNDLYQDWENRAKEAGIVKENIQMKEQSINIEKATENSINFSLEKLSERRSIFDKKDFLMESLKEGLGNINIDDLEKKYTDKLADKTIIETVDKRLTTSELVAIEKQTIEIMKKGIGSVENVTNDIEVSQGFEQFKNAKGFELSEGQKESAMMILTGQDRVLGVEGFAGTGKTTMLEFVKEQAEKNGYIIKGYCPSSEAAKVLQKETGIESTTLASHLLETSKNSTEKKKEIWIIDEASMVSAQQAKKLLEAAEKAGARTSFLGDRKQLSSVEAGKPFALLVDEGMKMSSITEIRRQGVDGKLEKKLLDRGYTQDQVATMKEGASNLKKAVYESIEGKVEESLSKVNIIEIKERDERLNTIVSDFKKLGKKDKEETLIITSTNEDKRYTNDKIREVLKEEGTITGQELKTTVLLSNNLEKAEMRKIYNYKEGDVIRFNKAYRSLGENGVENGDYGVIKAVDPRGTVTLEVEGKGIVAITPATHTNIELYKQEEKAIQKGDILRYGKNDKDLGLRNGEKATVLDIDHKKREVRLQIGTDEKTYPIDKLKHFDHGYAITVHSSQGKTCERVMINFDIEKAKLLGLESFYVAISRAKIEAKIYTNNTAKLPDLLKKSMAQESAVEAIKNIEIKKFRDSQPGVYDELINHYHNKPLSEKQIAVIQNSESIEAITAVKNKEYGTAREYIRETLKGTDAQKQFEDGTDAYHKSPLNPKQTAFIEKFGTEQAKAAIQSEDFGTARNFIQQAYTDKKLTQELMTKEQHTQPQPQQQPQETAAISKQPEKQPEVKAPGTKTVTKEQTPEKQTETPKISQQHRR